MKNGAASLQSNLQQFHWTPQPRAQALVNELIDAVLARSPGLAQVRDRMRNETGTRFHDWVDHLRVPHGHRLRDRLHDVGFTLDAQAGVPDCFVHHGAMFPAIILEPEGTPRIFLKVDSVTDFLCAWGIADDPRSGAAAVEGEPFAQVRMVRAIRGREGEIWAIERHGSRSMVVPPFDAKKALLSVKHLEAFRRRKRDFWTDEGGYVEVERLVHAAVADLGPDWACDLFFQGERAYWQSRNTAARFQKARQDRLGLGWANHDHHTYRSSRKWFPRLVGVLERLGFHCRERFYAGAESGWGAQVLEQPVAGITIFADVDLDPHELSGDFAHDPMPARKKLGTIGLWCGLHGESMLQAGLHHLECQFDWWALKAQLEREGHIRMLDPFTTLPYLRQAFTEGEHWPVSEARIHALLAEGFISEREAEQFRHFGAGGSHLESLERNDGFKGFNQQGVSDIIARTDPRRELEAQTNPTAAAH